MSGDSSGEKTEEPTAQKLKKARQEGQIGRSQDIGAWFGMLAASVLLPMAMENAMKHAVQLMEKVPTVIADPDPAVTLNILQDGLMGAGLAVAPLAFTMLAVGIAAAGAQGGIRVATKLFIPKFSRLNPFKGLKRVFGMQAIWEGAKALVKTAVLGGVLYISIQDLVPLLMTAGQLPLGALLSIVKDAIITVIRTAAGAGIVMAAADYFVVRRRTNKQLRMSKDEVKREHKQSEGDPHLKGAIRSKQIAMARNRQMAEVPNADLIMVNPTHVAVALRYEPAKGAPRVIAKGSGTVATKIRELAAKHRVPMVQDVPLARALHASCEVGQEIPPEFYGAVAKVLAFVMSLKAKGSAAGVHRNPGAGLTNAA